MYKYLINFNYYIKKSLKFWKMTKKNHINLQFYAKETSFAKIFI